MLEVFIKKLLFQNKPSKKKVSFTSSAPDITVGSKNTISFTCEDPISGECYLYVEGYNGPLVAEVHDSSVTFNISGELLSGSKSVLFVYSGDDDFEEYAEIVRFEVSKISHRLSVTCKDIHLGSDEIVTIGLPSDVVKIGYAVVTIAGYKYFSSEINSKAKVRVPNLAAGKYTAVGNHYGSEKYIFQSGSNSFTVSKTK